MWPSLWFDWQGGWSSWYGYETISLPCFLSFPDITWSWFDWCPKGYPSSSLLEASKENPRVRSSHERKSTLHRFQAFLYVLVMIFCVVLIRHYQTLLLVVNGFRPWLVSVLDGYQPLLIINHYQPIIDGYDFVVYCRFLHEKCSILMAIRHPCLKPPCK